MIGQTVSHYRIVEKLGQGGMGVVYKAHDLNLDRAVALKFLPPELGRDPDSKARFINEAKAASKLQHENICTIHEISQTDDGQMFIVMDYYEGKTLKQQLLELKMASIGETIDTVMQIGRGLQAAHAKGIIHRDIKPSNIIMTPDGTVKILDFGLARSIDHSGVTQTGQTPGTLAYMSPEQATGGKVDHRTDIWSLGVLLYEMVAGVRPFEAEIGPALVFLITQQQSRKLSDMRDNVPDILDRIVRKALEKNPEKRYGTIQKMLEELREAKECLAAGGDSPRKRMLLKMRRPAVAIPISLLIIVIVGGIGLVIHRQNRIAWAREVLLPTILEDKNHGRRLEAMQSIRELQRYDPSNPSLPGIIEDITYSVTINTVPPGAQIYWKPCIRPDAAWELLGTSSFGNLRVVAEPAWFRLEKEGFASRVVPVFVLLGGAVSSAQSTFVLDTVGSFPNDMIRMDGGAYETYITRLRSSAKVSLNAVKLGDFLVDRCEVTNKEYKRFVDAGGYATERYWKVPITENGNIIPWREAVEKFCDPTGQPGPSTWEGGTYPEGMENYPVHGVSWYEAAAYAEFAGKRLPSVYHVAVLGDWLEASVYIPLSNFGGRGPVPVGTSRALGAFGTSDLGGNVREWCWNPYKGGRFILGGAWLDPAYMYYEPRTLSPFDRSSGNGFRCIIDLHPEADQEGTWDTVSIVTRERNYLAEKPVDETTFDVIRRFYDYEKTELHPEIQSRDTSNPEWIREYVTIDAAYNGERFGIYLFLPRSGQPPYQAVIYYPCADAYGYRSSAEHLEMKYTAFLIAGGRALIYPVYKGMYERRMISEKTGAHAGEGLAMRIKDLRRALDYAETRSDLDHHRIAYESYSWGWGHMVHLALEPRITTAILISGGISQSAAYKKYPELDCINFLPRVTMPTLLVTGEYDILNPYETTQKPAFMLLGTASQDRKHALLKTDHCPRREVVIKEILPWLDKYLGPVKRNAQ